MDNVQNCDSYIHVPPSQTYRTYFFACVVIQATFSLPYQDTDVKYSWRALPWLMGQWLCVQGSEVPVVREMVQESI
jgi:hypothetical protein